MKEDLLWYVWRLKAFNTKSLQTINNESVTIIESGQLNKNAGPDFSSGRVKIGEQEWSGNIEMHVRSSEWNNHNHQTDPAYNNVILHVVFEHDEDIKTQDGRELSTIELKGRIPDSIIETYERLLSNQRDIPCSNQIKVLPDTVINSWLSRVHAERLERKSKELELMLTGNGGDWEKLNWLVLARYFGAPVNDIPFRLVLQSIPLRLFSKYANNPLKIEALLFGQAGWLEDIPKDEYQANLQKEYSYLKDIHDLKAVKVSMWKFMRMRPNNFPTRRMAQLAVLMQHYPALFSKFRDVEDFKAFRNLFKDLSLNTYWSRHYHFGKEASRLGKGFGEQFIKRLFINVLVPVIFTWSKLHDDPAKRAVTLKLMTAIKPENNHIIKRWKKIGVEPQDAADSQALLTLYNKYCSHKKCLSCAIGYALINNREYGTTDSIHI